MGAMLATFGELAEFHVVFNSNWGSVTLIYGERRKKRMMRRKPCVPGNGGGGGGAKLAPNL